jgi:serine/threonine-protein kinase
MLTGVLPSDGDDVVDLLLKQATQAPPRMSSVLGAIPPMLDSPVLQMMEKDPSNRPASLLSAVDALTQAAQMAGVTIPGAVPLRNVPPAPVSAKIHDHSTAMAATLVPGSEPASSSKAAGGGRGKLIALVIGAVGLFGTIGAVVAMQGASAGSLPVGDRGALAASVVTTASAPASVPASASASAPAVPTVVPLTTASARLTDEVELTITDAPAGAQVFLGAAKLGEAPGPLRIRRGESPLQLTVKANGYRPKTIEFIPVASGAIEAKLGKIAKAGPAVNGDLEKPY